MPYVLGDLEGLYLGEPGIRGTVRDRRYGFSRGHQFVWRSGDEPERIQDIQAKTLIGTSLIVKGPTGQYDSSKLINIGTNRWSFKPEIGVVHVIGHWAIDVYVGGWFFTDNTDFIGGMTREQDPILSTQFHVRYLFKPWVVGGRRRQFLAGWPDDRWPAR